MKNILISLGLVLMVALGSSLDYAQAPAAPPIYNPTNPQPGLGEDSPSVSVGADHRVTFRVHAPEAKTVSVSGDFLLGAPAAKLSQGSDGTWSYTT